MDKLSHDTIVQVLIALEAREEYCQHWMNRPEQTENGRAYWMGRLAAVEAAVIEIKSHWYGDDPAPADETPVDDLDIDEVGPHAGAVIKEYLDDNYSF